MPSNYMVRSFQPGVASPVLLSPILTIIPPNSITDLKGELKKGVKTVDPIYFVSQLKANGG